MRGMGLIGEAHLWLFRGADSTARGNMVAFSLHQIPLTFILSHPGEEALKNTQP
ncbi:MAG TPA: hypothetical protein VL403_04695 [Candidatus Kryptonia bacterium]|nr:hypothetical protein [Candidatus Kryptonia bacterium]